MVAVWRPLLQALVFAAVLVAAAPAGAHQLKAAISTVLFNERTGDIEVMHRFYSHDAEHAVGLITGRGADLVGDVGDRMRFAVYVHERFALTGLGTELAPLELVGAELDGDYLWVYERTAQVEGLNGLAMRFDALRELWPSQVNTVNVEQGGQVRTLVFDADDTVLRLEF